MKSLKGDDRLLSARAEISRGGYRWDLRVILRYIIEIFLKKSHYLGFRAEPQRNSGVGVYPAVNILEGYGRDKSLIGPVEDVPGRKIYLSRHLKLEERLKCLYGIFGLLSVYTVECYGRNTIVKFCKISEKILYVPNVVTGVSATCSAGKLVGDLRERDPL